MPPKRGKAAAAKASSSSAPARSKAPALPLPRAWQPPSSQPAPTARGCNYNIDPDEYYPTGDYWNALPVFKPSWDQFRDFYSYVRRISHEGMKSGIVKIVPPKEWLDLQGDLSERLASVKIKHPLQQLVQSGGEGTYQQTNQQVQRDLSVQEWIELCQSIDHRGPELRHIQHRLQERYQLEEIIAASYASRPAAKKRKRAVEQQGEGIAGNAQPDAPADATQPVSPPQSQQGAPAAVPDLPQPDAALPTPPRSISATSPPHLSSYPTQPTPTEPPGITPSEPPAEPTTSQSSTASGSIAASPAPPPRPLTQGKYDYKRAWMYEYLPAAEAAKASAEEFTIDVCAEIETEYWRTLGQLRSTGGSAIVRPAHDLSKGALYGADQCGSLFDRDMAVWNIGKLDNVLTRMLGCINESGDWVAPEIDADGEIVDTPAPVPVGGGKGKGKGKQKAQDAQQVQVPNIDELAASAIAGVTTPYLYFGMWQATFSWHVEDLDLCSINYIHFGAPKQWYAIPQQDRYRFETAMAACYPSDARRCKQFLRHKSYLVNPSRLASIRPLKMVQHAGEIVLTFPYGYHSGYNLGFNCAESTNFALDDWVRIGMDAKVCECADREQQVYIDVKELYADAMAAERAASRRGRELDDDFVAEQDEDDDSYVEDDDDEDEANRGRRKPSGGTGAEQRKKRAAPVAKPAAAKTPRRRPTPKAKSDPAPAPDPPEPAPTLLPEPVPVPTTAPAPATEPGPVPASAAQPSPKRPRTAIRAGAGRTAIQMAAVVAQLQAEQASRLAAASTAPEEGAAPLATGAPVDTARPASSLPAPGLDTAAAAAASDSHATAATAAPAHAATAGPAPHPA